MLNIGGQEYLSTLMKMDRRETYKICIFRLFFQYNNESKKAIQVMCYSLVLCSYLELYNNGGLT